MRRPETNHAGGFQHFFINNIIEHCIAIVKKYACFLTFERIVEDGGIFPVDTPGVEEESPVDVFANFSKVVIFKGFYSCKRGLINIALFPVDFDPVLTRLLQRNIGRFKASVFVAFANGLIFLLDSFDKILFPFFRNQGRNHRHAAGCIAHMDDRRRILRIDFYGSVNLAGGGSTNEQRELHIASGHLLRHIHHLLERWGNQSAQPDNVHFFCDSGIQNFRCRHHDAQVYDLKIITSQDHTHDIFTNVVDVAFYRCHQYFTGRMTTTFIGFLSFDVWEQNSNSFFHHARTFYHLRQKHLARSKKVAHHVHAIHQRLLYHINRPRIKLSRFFYVLIDMADDAFDKRVLQALLHRQATPGILMFRLFILLLQLFSESDKTVGGIFAAVEHRIFDELQEVGRDFVVNLQHARIDDSHVHSRFDGMIEKHRVHGFAHLVVALKSKRKVAHPATHTGVWEVLFYPAGSFDVIDRVVVVRLNARCNR